MKDRIPTLVAFFILTILVLGTWWASDYVNRAVPLDQPSQITHEPDSWGQDVSILISDINGLLQSRIDGDALRHYLDDDSIEIDKAVSINKGVDSPQINGTSDVARIFDKGDRIQMNGNGYIHRMAENGSSPLDIYSEEFFIYPKQDLIETDKPVNVLQGNSNLNGSGMKYNTKTKRLEVFANTGVKIAPEDYPSNKPKPTQAIKKQPNKITTP